MIAVDTPRGYEPNRGLYTPVSEPLVYKPGAYLPPRARERVRHEAAQLGPRGTGGNGLLGAAANWLPSSATSATLVAWYRYGVGLTTSDTTLGEANNFAHANWTKTNVSITASQSDPFGGSTASLMTESVSGTAAHNVRHSFSNQGTNALMRVSFYAKPNGRNWVWVGDNTADRCFFNVSTGVVGSTPGTGVRNPTITAAGGGWYLCQFYVKATSSNLDIGLGNADNSLSYAGDGTSGAFIYTAEIYQRRVSQWDDQTSNAFHITQGTDVQRPFWELGKGITCIRAAQQWLTRASGGPSQTSNHSIFALARFDEVGASFQGLAAIGSGGSATSAIGANGSNLGWHGGHGLTGPVGVITLVAGTRYRIGKVVTGANTQGYLNGATDGTTASNAYDAGSTAIHVGNYNATGTNVGNWTILEVVYYSGALSSPDLTSLNTYLQQVSALAA